MTHEFIKYLKVYKPKEFLITEGEQDKSFFCLLQGSVGIWKGDPTDLDKMIKVGELKDKGSYFGEMSYFLNEPRTASITAISEVKTLCFPSEMLPLLINKQPKLGFKICEILAERLKGTTNKTEAVAMERDELRGDATNLLFQAKESYQKLFMILSAFQAQFQHPTMKEIVEYMSHNKLLQGGKQLHLDEAFYHDLTEKMTELVQKFYTDDE